MLLKCKPTQAESTTPPPSLRGSHNLGRHPPALIPPGQGPDNEDSPCTQDLLELFTPAHPNPAQPPHLFCPVETTVKALV